MLAGLIVREHIAHWMEITHKYILKLKQIHFSIREHHGDNIQIHFEIQTNTLCNQGADRPLDGSHPGRCHRSVGGESRAGRNVRTFIFTIIKIIMIIKGDSKGYPTSVGGEM